MADWVRSKKIATKRIKMDLFKEIQKAQKQLEGVVQTTPLAENKSSDPIRSEVRTTR